MKRLSILFAITAIFALPMVACGDDDGGTQEICGNGIDDDGNGQADCLDSACTNSSYCQQACNNDGICGAGETATNCMADCHCGNGICDSAAPYNETATSCASDCAANPCDNDGTCEPAQGETATNCPADCAANPCDNDGTCEPAQGETATNCPADCATNPCNNNGTCEAGETATNCPADCGAVTCPDQYGTFTEIDFATNFILDDAQLSNQQYQTDHQSAIQMSAAFEGTWQTGDLAIPPAGAAGTMAYAVHAPAEGADPAYVYMVQMSLDGAQEQLDPIVQVQFGSDAITTGTKTVGLTQSDEVVVILFSPVGANGCLAGIAIGSITIDVATNTTAADGGTLEFSGSNLVFYHPTNVGPYGGDITAQLPATLDICDCL